MKKVIKLTESDLTRIVERVIKENMGWANMQTFKPMDEQETTMLSKDEIRKKGQEIQSGLNTLSNQLKNKEVTIDDKKYFIQSLNLSQLFRPRKNDTFLEGEIEVEYSESQQGSKMRASFILGHIKTDDKPYMVSNEFTTFFPESFTGGKIYHSTELQNYLNSVVTKVLGNK